MRRLCCLTTALVGALGSALGYAPGGFAQQQSVYLARSQGADPRPNDSLDPISRAAEQVAQYSSLSAKVRQRVDVFGSSMVGTGLYLQQKQQQGRGAPHKLRLELKMQVDARTSSFQQVCDGRFLWTHLDLLGNTSLARIDLRKVDSVLATSSAAARPSTALQLAGGGLPKLMQGLADNFAFGSPAEEQLDGLTVLSLAGDWRPERLALLLPGEKARLDAGQGVDPTKLPAQLPERVVIKLGADDYFPYRIEFWRRELTSDKESPLGPFKAVVVVEFYEVQVNSAIDARQFDYKPGDLEFSDHTKELLRSLGIDPDAQAQSALQAVQQH